MCMLWIFKLAVGLDNRHLSPSTTEIPLDNNFGQIYLATAFGLPISHKLTLFCQTEESEGACCFVFLSLSLTFLLANGVSLTKLELIAVCMAHEFADEVINCTGNAKRIQHISEQVCVNPNSYL